MTSRPVLKSAKGSFCLADAEPGLHNRATKLKGDASYLLFKQLVWALHLTEAKVRAKRNEVKELEGRIEKKHPHLPKRRSLDLWIQTLLAALASQKRLPSSDRKTYRQDPKPLYRIMRADLQALAKEYVTMAALRREFIRTAKKTEPLKKIEKLIHALMHAVDQHPDVELDETLLSVLQSVIDQLRKKPASRNGALNAKAGMRSGSVMANNRKEESVKE